MIIGNTRFTFQILLIFTVAIAVGCGGSPVSNVTETNANTAEKAATAAAPMGGVAQTSASSAEELIKELYKQHDAKKSPFFQTKDRARVDRFFTRSLADLIWNDAKTAEGEIGAIDFDPLYDAQDTEIKDLAVGTAEINGESGTVPVTFSNYGEKKTLKFSVVRSGESWRISDIRYPAGHSLVKLIKDNTESQKMAAKSGEFEGKYQVGDTTCVVSPARQSFTVKWAKGSGVEYFFYKDANAFESEEDKNGLRNEFRFDDDTYNTGTFYRGDGKTFPVRRAK